MQTILQSLNTALHHVFDTDERVHLIGEDVLDPYGGAFKVTQGLSTTYPDRVHTSPVSEAGIVSIATGMALRNLRPVVEIMFGDFTTLIADQVVNHITKFRYMYNDQVHVPIVIRTPMGGRRGYGATHSQTLEKIFLGVPGLRVVAPCALQHKSASQQVKMPSSPGELLAYAILDEDDPVLFVENKLLYLVKVQNSESLGDFDLSPLPPSPQEERGVIYPTYRLSLRGAPPAFLTITAYGHMAELARVAMSSLAYEYEIFTELVVPTQLAPVEITHLLTSLRRTGRLLTIEEGTLSQGWGSEVVARALEALGRQLKVTRRLAAQETAIPASGPLEAATLPGVEDIVNLAQKMV